MSCIEQKKGRYVSAKRKSPPFAAGDCKGQTKKGLDGKMYESVKTNRKTKSGKIVYRWKSVASVSQQKSAAPKKKSVKNKFREEYMKRKQKLSEVQKKIKNIQSKEKL